MGGVGYLELGGEAKSSRRTRAGATDLTGTIVNPTAGKVCPAIGLIASVSR